MAAVMDRHSRLVAWLKILLPLLALALLSTIFMVAKQIDPAQTIPYSQVDVEELAREQRIGSPSYSGVAGGGASVRFDAQSARPEVGGGRLIAVEPRTRIDFPGGRTVTLTAASGEFDSAASVVSLDRDVVVAISDGYRLESAAIRVDLADGLVESPGAVTGNAPFGTLAAGSMRLRRGADGQHVLGFEGGVKLVYLPQD